MLSKEEIGKKISDIKRVIDLFCKDRKTLTIYIEDFELFTNYIEQLETREQNILDEIRGKINERQFELQQEYKDFKDDIRLNTLQEIYYMLEGE